MACNRGEVRAHQADKLDKNETAERGFKVRSNKGRADDPRLGRGSTSGEPTGHVCT